MADNLVSQPPLMTQMVDDRGMLHRAWSIWFRDLYRRTSFKGDNAIDDVAIDINNLKNASHPSTASQVQFLQRQIDGLPKFTCDTTGFTADSTEWTADKDTA